MSGREMKFPYTFSAQLAQFPISYYYHHKNGWVLKYWMWCSLGCLPLWYYFQKLSYHPNNVKKWQEIHKEQFSGKMRH